MPKRWRLLHGDNLLQRYSGLVVYVYWFIAQYCLWFSRFNAGYVVAVFHLGKVPKHGSNSRLVIWPHEWSGLCGVCVSRFIFPYIYDLAKLIVWSLWLIFIHLLPTTQAPLSNGLRFQKMEATPHWCFGHNGDQDFVLILYLLPNTCKLAILIIWTLWFIFINLSLTRPHSCQDFVVYSNRFITHYVVD